MKTAKEIEYSEAYQCCGAKLAYKSKQQHFRKRLSLSDLHDVQQDGLLLCWIQQCDLNN